ncbi:MAG: DUF2200 family protein [Chitinophagaceae bacterium]|nr:DUF2200 family protein [Chitinophagaceae bacterium]
MIPNNNFCIFLNFLSKLVDEFAKGKSMDKILRQ